MELSVQESAESHDHGVGLRKMGELNECLDPPSLDLEAERLNGLPQAPKALSSLVVLQLAFQSLGIVYGDLGTSPLYVYHSTFPDGIEKEEDLMGVLSLIIYTLTLIPLIKYTCIVMRATDDGEGGTFALYSLICRYAKINTIPNQHPTDRELTTYVHAKVAEKSAAGKVKRWLELKSYRQNLLVILVLVGTCMLIGDGILTPAISVISSVGGIKVNNPDVNNDWVVAIACAILIIVFNVQRFGTDRVGWVFAPAVFLWLCSIGSVGVYNIIKHNPSVLRAFSPVYVLRYFIEKKKKSWLSLGGVLLSITGTEALYADVGHFSALSVQIAFAFLVFPCLLASYLGQAAYLSRFPEDVSQAFYMSIPEGVYWPMFVIATVAAVIASQATIAATFSVIKQSLALGCFPRVKIVHTSKKYKGQVYIPEINWMLMVLCIIATAGFRRTIQLGNAYGIAVVAVMIVTTLLMALVMVLVWRIHTLLILLFVSISLFVELVFFSAVLVKFKEGGWAPLAIATLFLLVMYVWHYGTLKLYEYDMQNKVSMAWILGLGPSLGLVRVPGIGFIYTELAHGVPSIFTHFMTHLPAIHSVVIFVCVKYLPVKTVPQEERFLIRRIGPADICLYRCVARYGYLDSHKKDDPFEDSLLEHLLTYVRENPFSEGSPISMEDATVVDPSMLSECSLREASSTASERIIDVSGSSNLTRHVRFAIPREERETRGNDALYTLQEARQAGVVHILGDVIVRARKGSNIFKRFAVDYLYVLLRRICQGSSATLNIPHESLFSIGQVYYV